MFKILKYMKQSAVALVFVVILLVLQVFSDLSLPTYTSDIINIGVMKSGINSSVPSVIRASELDRIFTFVSDADKQTVLSHYTLLDKSKLSSDDLTKYEKKYPAIDSEPLYQWDKKAEKELTSILAGPMTLVYGIESDSPESKQMTEPITSQMPPQVANLPGDIIDKLNVLPAEAKAPIIKGMSEFTQKMPEMVTSSTASFMVKAEYEKIGINVGKIQSNYILLVGAKMIGLALVSMLAAIFVTLIAARVAARMGRLLRSKVFKKVLAFSNTEMDNFSTASLITRSTNDIQQVQMLIVMMIRIVIYSPLLALGGIFKVLNTNTSMTWTLALGVGAVFVLIATLLIIALPKFKLMQKLVDRVNLVMREILSGLPVIRAFNTEKHEQDRFDKANKVLTKNQLFVSRTMNFMFPILFLIMNFVSLLIMWVGAHKIDAGGMQVGDMIAFIQYTMQIIMSFLMLTMLSVILPRAAVAANRIDEVISTEESIKDPDKEELCDIKKKGLLEFNHVNFRYPNAEEDVLSDISFVAKPGETTAIIGSTGSGKSTLINLIPRFYDITSGSIELDGLDVRRMTQHTLRSKIGFVPQKGVLFSGTIESNIAFGKPDASDEEVAAAARIAQAAEFIEAKPEGYEAPISEGGTNVSGGQKQRLSIARAIAKHPEVYIFDDSFSALDYKTDAALRKALKEELSESTVIIVAQRISTIMNAEQILVLDEGRIVGMGTHKELLKDCEVYKQIASSQLSKEELDHE